MPRYHPDGVANLVACILAPEDIERARGRRTYAYRAAQRRELITEQELLNTALDARRDQVLRLAREYYRVNPCDYDNSYDRQRQRNAMNNLAKLNRANLR